MTDIENTTINTNIPVFIIHYKKLTERKEYLTKTLTEHGFTKIHWFEHIDRDTLTEEQKKMYIYNPAKWLELNAVWRHYESEPRPLTGPEIACALTHIEIYKYIMDNGIQRALILEDDVIFKSNFTVDFKATMDEIDLLGPNFDMCFLNDAFGWTVDNYKEENGCGYLGYLNKNTFTKDKHLYRMYCGKCCDSYIISNNAAKTLYENIIPIYVPIDWMHTPIIITKDMKVFWTEPAITHQGSVDVYQSSMMRPNECIEEIEEIVATPVEEAEADYTLSDIEELKLYHYRKFKGEVADSTYSYLEKYMAKRLQEFENNIKTYRPETKGFKNFILVKFGDGEMRNMTSTNENDHNCDNCFYYRGLGLELIKSYIYFLKNKNAHISKWHSHTYTIQKEIEKDYAEYINTDNEKEEVKFVYYDIIVHKLEYKDEINNRMTFRPEKVSFFKAIKESNRIKVYLSNVDMINAVASILKLNYGISIPATNSYLYKDEILKVVSDNMEQAKIKLGLAEVKDFIFLFSGGMFAKVLIAELSQKYPKNTFIDMGSTFDGLIKCSRDFNGTIEYRDELLKYYKY